MNDSSERLRSRLTSAHAEALKVGDSPLRADRLADQLEATARDVAGGGLGDERAARVSAAIANAVRVLRRDDDGREAARHLQEALKQFSAPARKPSPFADDL
jgi:hypothetical protein